MMNDSSAFRQAEDGLCASCVHAQIVTSNRQSQFYLCRLSAVDARFPKYPRLPVVSCAGFRPQKDTDDSR